MEYIFYEHPDNSIYKQLEAVLDCCRRNNEDVYPLCGDELQYFDTVIIAADSENAVGFIAASYTAMNSVEIIGAVIPEKRRNGIFSEMLKHFQNFSGQADIVFSGRKTYNGFIECAGALGYTDMDSEQLMVFDNSHYTPMEAESLDVQFDDEDLAYYYYIGEEAVGSCSIYEEDFVINIYDVFVYPEYRNQGYGSIIISDVLSDLINSGKKIQLQVSGNNTPALRLYTKCGFVTADTVILLKKHREHT